MASAANVTALAADSEVFRGQLLTTSGEAIANSDLHIRSLDVSTRTNESGEFEFVDLPAGRYVLDVESRSFGHSNHDIVVTSQSPGERQVVRIDPTNPNTIVVYGHPLEHRPLDMARPALVLSGDELIEKRSGSIGETLSGEAGVNVAGFGPGVGRPVVRGQQGNRVAVLSNNLSTLDASSTSPDHWITTEPLLAKQIEVLKGPATLMYGGGAIGGVVNVIDNRIPEYAPEDGIDGGLEIRHGDSATEERAVVGSLDLGKDGIAFHLDAYNRNTADIEIPDFVESSQLRATEEEEEGGEEEEELRGTLPNSDIKSDGGSAGVSFIGDRGFVGFSFTQHNKNYGLPGSHGHEEEEEEGGEEEEEEIVRLDLEQRRFDVKGEFSDPFAGFEEIRFAWGNVDYTHTEFEGEETGTVFDNEAYEGRVELVHEPLADFRGVIGFQFGNRDFSAIGEEAFVPPSETETQGLFIIEEKELGSFHLELGARVDRQEIDADGQPSYSDNALSFSGGGIWELSDNWSLPVYLSHAERMPTAEELYSFGPHLATQSFEVGNPDLDTETSNNFDIGLRYQVEDVTISLAAFYNRIDDFIFEAPNGEEEDDLPVFVFTQEDATFSGFELDIDWRFYESNWGEWTLGVLADYTRGELNDGGDLPRIPPMRLGGSLGYYFNEWNVELSAVRYDEQDKVADFELATDGFTLVNLGISRNFGFENSDLLLFLRANNLLDEDARDHSSFIKDFAPRPGRSVVAGFRWSF